jgi:hypothetical protein
MRGFQIYIQEEDKKTFKESRQEIKQLWYRKYGESLSLSNIIIKSLIYLRDYLKSSETVDVYDSKRKDLYKYERVRK